MTVRIAAETIKKINRTIEHDQGASFRQNLKKVIMHFGDIYRGEDTGFREHLGASIIGGECARAIKYGYHWTVRPRFRAAILRLFNRGHLEEPRFVAMLLMISVIVYQQDAEGKQFRISHANGHMGGSGDGVGVDIPELAKGQYALLEFKTHGEKSFIELAGKNWKEYVEALMAGRPIKFEGKGVKEAKFEHYVQMQCYMRKMGIAAALYMAVNKNTDEIYAEIVILDSVVADQYLERGERIVYLESLPKRISESPGFFKCKFCDFRVLCHDKGVPERNCRTCQHSKPSPKSKSWICTFHDVELNEAQQLAGCQNYEVSKMFK